ncbi:TetR/AcrR family transcriptional regulator [Geothrix sp. 21YS21S-4]|uniref:TetR/AcrR family transcriptional regulator n=1 Tax=Geothrix sp. 21YS21S-4 TaxID=3068889 RepID=UPI0027B8FB18|nr:TetR/AcrR family transcriptional regulator [Geothrix sp. 21YS21S-4]
MPQSVPRPRGPKPHRVAPDQILDAAQAVFTREGLRAASLRAIARQAGCDPALIYYHFDSKEAMFTALLDRRIPPLVEDLQRLADPADARPMPLRLWDVLGIYQRRLGGDAGLRSLIRGEIVKGAEGIHALIQEKVLGAGAYVRALLQQGVARGEIRPDIHPLLTTFFLVRLQLEILDLLPVVGAHVMGLAPEVAVAEGERAWLQLFWRGIAADPFAPLPPLPAR